MSTIIRTVNRVVAAYAPNASSAREPGCVNIAEAPYYAVGDGVTPNDTAFINFRAWVVAQTGSTCETFPLGNYALTNLDLPLHSTGVSIPPFESPKNLKVWGNGSTLQGGIVGGFAVEEAGFPVNTVSAGSLTVTFVNLADATTFATDSNGNPTKWALMTGIDMQAPSYPPNDYYFEYLEVESVNLIAGTATFKSALQNSYKDTWPSYNFYSTWVDGAATLYKLDPRFDCDVEMNDFIFSKAGESNAGGRRITLNNCSWPNGGIVPSNTQLFVANDCQLCAVGQQVEYDKMVTNGYFNNCTSDGLFIVQSASNEYITIVGGTYNIFSGTPKNLSMRGVVVTGDFTIGPIGFGITTSVYLEDCSFGGTVGWARCANFISDFGFAAGVFSRANTSGPVTWAIPGAKAWFFMTIDPQYVYSSFTITDVTQDATNTYVHTDLAALPSWSGAAFAAPDSMGTVGCSNVTAVNCTGALVAVDMSNAPANSPVGTYCLRTLQGNLTGNAYPSNIKVWGSFVKYRINVTQAYTGAQPTCLYEIGGRGGAPVYDSGFVLQFWDPVINLKIAGERIITQSGATGLQAGDSVPSASGLHLVGSINPWLNTDISGDSPAQQPILEIEVITDQS